MIPFYSMYRVAKCAIPPPCVWPLGLTHTIDREKKYRRMGRALAVGRVRPRRRQDHHPRLAIFQPGAQPRLWKAIRISGRFTNTTASHPTRWTASAPASFSSFIRHGERKEHRDRQGIPARGFLAVLHPPPGFQRQRAPANPCLLEPILPDQREASSATYRPLYSLWRSENNPRTGAASQSLLWNLYRRECTPASKKISLLFGLFQYQSDTEGSALARVLYSDGSQDRPVAGIIVPEVMAD